MRSCEPQTATRPPLPSFSVESARSSRSPQTTQLSRVVVRCPFMGRRMKYAPRHGQLCGGYPCLYAHLGVGIAQKPAMQTIPLVAVPQQSDDAVHFSSTFEHPTGG